MRLNKLTGSRENSVELRQVYHPKKKTLHLSHYSSLNDLNQQHQEFKSSSNSNTKSNKSLPSVISTSSLSSLTSNHSNYSTPSITSPTIFNDNKLKKNHSLSALHHKLNTNNKYNGGSFVNTTTFSAPISPKYADKDIEDSHKLPSIHKYLKQRHCNNKHNKSNNSIYGDMNPLENAILVNNHSYSLNDKICQHNIDKFRSSKLKKYRTKQHRNKNLKRNESMPASLHLDLNKLSIDVIDENSNKLHSHHNDIKDNKFVDLNKNKIPKSAHSANLNLNADGIKNNILLQFDLAPKSIDNRSQYEITKNGSFKQNGFILSNNGLEIERVDNNNKYIVNSTDFVEVSILGRGSSSVVYKTWDLKNKQFIALKCISVFEQNKRKQIENELKLLTNNDCIHIINFYGSYFYSGQIMFCLEYFDMGSLQEFIEINGEIPLNIISYIIKYIIKAIHYLHNKKNIIYRDIKPSNILIHSNGMIKLSDFGIIHQFDDGTKNNDSYCNEIIGTTIYMSPQRLSGKKYSYLSDIWSIGICIAHSLYPKFPLFTNYNDSTKLIEKYILSSTKPIYQFFPNNVNITDLVKDFMQKCLAKEEYQRLSANKLLKHEFIIKYNKMNENDFKSYLLNSNMNKLKIKKYKNELISIKQSLSQLIKKNKITKQEMKIPINHIQQILDSHQTA